MPAPVVGSKEPEKEPEPVTTPDDEESKQAVPQDAPVAETGGHDQLDGMTMMDATPPAMEHRQTAEPQEEVTSSPVREHEEDRVEEQVPRDPSLAGQTLVGEDDFLDELAGGVDKPGAEIVDPLDGQTIMDEVVEAGPVEIEEPPSDSAPTVIPQPNMEEPPRPVMPPGTRSQKIAKVVTVFQGDAWVRAEELAKKKPWPQPKPNAPVVMDSGDHSEHTLDVKGWPGRFLFVAMTICVVVILAVRLYSLAR